MELKEVQDGPGEEGRMKLNWMKSSLEWKGPKEFEGQGVPQGRIPVQGWACVGDRGGSKTLADTYYT